MAAGAHDGVDIQTLIRQLLLEAIILNRKRDPLGALAKLQIANDTAKNLNAEFQIDHRLAELYSELERWPAALTYLRHAEDHRSGLRASIYAVEARQCEAKAKLALGLDASKVLDSLLGLDKTMPLYIQFKTSALQTENALASGAAQSAIANVVRAMEFAEPQC